MRQVQIPLVQIIAREIGRCVVPALERQRVKYKEHENMRKSSKAGDDDGEAEEKQKSHRCGRGGCFNPLADLDDLELITHRVWLLIQCQT